MANILRKSAENIIFSDFYLKFRDDELEEKYLSMKISMIK